MAKFVEPILYMDKARSHVGEVKNLAGNPGRARAEFKNALLFLGKFKKHHKRRHAFGKDMPLYGEYLLLKAQVHAGLCSVKEEKGVKASAGFRVAVGYLDEYWKLVDEGKATEMRHEFKRTNACGLFVDGD